MEWMRLSYLRLAILWLQQSYLCITWQLPSVSGRLWEELLSVGKGGDCYDNTQGTEGTQKDRNAHEKEHGKLKAVGTAD